jgi:putative ATP-binding cassette transporter
VLSFLIRRSLALMLAATLASVGAGLCSVLLIAQINAALTSDAESRAGIAWLFAAVAVALMLSRMSSVVLFERLG